MSDNLGLNQTRVLDSDNRNFESVVYQRKKPPLSCEWNFTSNLASVHTQDTARFVVPSGWALVGAIKDDVTESLCDAGDVVCSSGYTANTFKLLALDKDVETQTLVAWVNGWKIVLQGTDSVGDENNIIILDIPPTTSYRVDFVFLEVWRKLLTITDVIYKHGNKLYGGVNYSNDLVDPAINIETSLRIQTQYRIRIVSDIDIQTYPEGFDPNKVFVQGPLDAPLSTCSHAYFSPVPGDPGLWRAGVGDSGAQEALETVDGYTYAVPMFAIHRRNSSPLGYDTNLRSNTAVKSLANYLVGQPSDRPDNRYNNWIVADDILDLRHRITPENNMKEICESSFQKLTSGTLRGKLKKTTLGEDHFGTILVRTDAVSYKDPAGATLIASGDGTRRNFSNAELYQPDTLVHKTVFEKTDGTIGANWAIGDRVQFNISGYPAGSTVSSLNEVYTSEGSLSDGTDYTSTGIGTNLFTMEVISGSSLIGDTSAITLDSGVNFAGGPYGLTELPEAFLEFRNEDTTSEIIASQEANIRVRSSDPVIASDGTHFNMLSNDGGNATEPYNFGHQMVYHTLGNGTQHLIIPRSLYGYDILGVVSTKIDSTYWSTSIIRSSNSYAVDLGSIVAINKDIELALYTRTKYFIANKQSRAIIDTFEMEELESLEVANGSLTTFHIDSTNRAIQALASNRSLNGYGIAYVDGTQKTLITNNEGLPTDTTKSRATIDFDYAPASGASIEVPVMMKSAIKSTEGYDFFYHAVPYQGLLDSTAIGVIEAVGPALITTAGSGAITDTTYSDGLAVFSADSTTVQGMNTRWLAGVKPSFVIRSDATPTKDFIISQVYSNDVLFITGKPDFTSAGGENYTIIGKDQPSFYRSNIIDRLPTYDSSNDSIGKSENISTAVSDGYPVLETRIISKVQDIIDASANSVLFGVDSADRGRSQISIPDAPLGYGNLGLKFEKLDSTGNYQKTYQSYILNRENDGKLYLMVIGSETDKSNMSRFFNENYNLDTVDIFEMPGRPITIRGTD